MLFDLRSPGRRRAVKGVYGFLALLLAGGLVLFGVGAGNGAGGLLNALTGGGSSGAQTQVVSQQEKQAIAAAKANPNAPQSWGNLLSARWTSAGEGSNYNVTTGTFTASGRRELTAAAGDWQRYLSLTKSPDPDLAILAAKAYIALGEFAGAAGAWETETLASPSEPKGYECLAVTAYAAGQSRKGDLAAAKALSLLPKAQQPTVKPSLTAAKASPATAKQIAAGC